jgi:hypothetical protein
MCAGPRILARGREIAERRLVLLVDERVEDLALALEVEVHGALRQVRALGDVLDSRREVATLDEDGPRRAEDLGPALGLWLMSRHRRGRS